MKKSIWVVVFIIVVVPVLSGCGVGELYKIATTKDPGICNVFQPGKTTQAEVEQQLGKPVGVAMSTDGKRVTYHSGYFTAKVDYDKAGFVREYECSKQ